MFNRLVDRVVIQADGHQEDLVAVVVEAAADGAEVVAAVVVVVALVSNVIRRVTCHVSVRTRTQAAEEVDVVVAVAVVPVSSVIRRVTCHVNVRIRMLAAVDAGMHTFSLLYLLFCPFVRVTAAEALTFRSEEKCDEKSAPSEKD